MTYFDRQPTEPLLPEESARIAESFVDKGDAADSSAEALLRRALLHHTRGEIVQSQSLLDQVRLVSPHLIDLSLYE